MDRCPYLTGIFSFGDSCLPACGMWIEKNVQARPATLSDNRGKGLAWGCTWDMSRHCDIGLQKGETSVSPIVRPIRALPMRRQIKARSSRAHCRLDALKNVRSTCSCQARVGEGQILGCGSINSRPYCPGVPFNRWRVRLEWRLPSLPIY